MRTAVTLFFLSSVLWANAQSDDLIIHGQTGGLYLEHTVMPKETWYSVGRLFNVEARTLAQYNHLTFAHPLAIDEVVKVPLTKVNFAQDGKKLSGESLVPVYHVVQEKEWLYRISVNHNKVPIPVLEKWNHVTGDQVHAGLHMVVGYLKVKTALSALAKRTGAPLADGGEKAGTTGNPEKVGTPADGRGVVQTEKPEKTDAHEALDAKVDSLAKKTFTTSPEPAVSHVASPEPAGNRVTLPAPQFNGGKFKAEFSDGGKSASGQAGVFKSTSGWQDGKYYALINSVPVGTIVKITDEATGKSVYAKVLGQLPDMKESAGLLVRLSNSAAAELGAGEGKFGVTVSY